MAVIDLILFSFRVRLRLDIRLMPQVIGGPPQCPREL
jgi:hypothetical protein